MDHLEKTIPQKTEIFEAIPPQPINSQDLKIIKSHLFGNIATQDHPLTKTEQDKVYNSMPGAIIASPSRIDSHFSQDYFFHWIRDAGIVMNELAYIYETTVG